MDICTKLFIECMEETGFFADCVDHPVCHKFRTGHKLKAGDLEVEPIVVDHSIPAAYGFIIHTSEGNVVYTGDLRRHGPRKDLTENFIAKAKEAEPIALITEGTRMAEKETRQNFTEPQVREIIENIVKGTDKAVFVMRTSRDVDRFRGFYEVAKRTGRKLVITSKTAYLLDKLSADVHLPGPDPLKDQGLKVYYKKKKSGTYDDKDYFMWERKFLYKMTDSKYVHKNQRKLIMGLDFYQLTELIDIKPEAGCQFIRSMSEPFSEEDIEDKVMHNWIDHFKMQFPSPASPTNSYTFTSLPFLRASHIAERQTTVHQP